MASKHAWHFYAPLVDVDRLTIDRDRFMAELKERNIGCGLHYSAAHEFSFYRRGTAGSRKLPEAHFVSEAPTPSFSGHDRVREAGRRRSGLRHRPEVPQVMPR